ncbi:MAG: lasso peptide biosynthesis B2 protein [Alphaproteobacteria bacterium]|nr:lasso peptide biosynthesis B2 protein [Alphaproteobacteria bacterium]
MNYHLSDHIYVTQFREELILLDTKKDKYTICFKEFSELLMNVLGRNDLPSNKDHFAASHSQNLLQRSTYIQKLLDDGILEKDVAPYPFKIDQKPHSEGVSNVDWRLPLENKNVGLNIHVLSALWTLIKVNTYIKFKGLYPTIQLIRKSRNPQKVYIIPQDEELRELANVVNKACLMYPSRTKCLEWAMTFVLMALKRKWRCNLEIGVQNYPFMAHAWVECDGKTVMDSQDLREGLGIILNEPFRKVAI